MIAATALAHGSRPTLSLVEQVVTEAMAKAGLPIAHTVILYLSDDYAHDPEPAILTAARTANCLQVVGCTCHGLFTEEDWILDAPAAAAMVLSEGLFASHPPTAADLIFTLAAPNAIDTSWLAQPGRRFGGVAGDATGQGPYQVWCHGRVSDLGRCELPLADPAWRLGLSQGVRALSPPGRVTGVDGLDILGVDQQPALFHLTRHLPADLGELQDYPVHLLMAGVPYGNPDTAVADGRYLALPVLSVNGENRSVTVASRLEAGSPLFWAQRQPDTAAQDMARTLANLAAAGGQRPDFALLFPCMGRGPFFFGGRDRDLELFSAQFPDVPMIGFHGNGEFAHLNGANRLLQYSTVVALHYPTAPAAGGA